MKERGQNETFIVRLVKGSNGVSFSIKTFELREVRSTLHGDAETFFDWRAFSEEFKCHKHYL